jgi:hypothetical protein
LWSGAAVASCVSSIDVVWDLLGSSLSILLSYLIPCGCYLALSSSSRRRQTRRASSSRQPRRRRQHDPDESLTAALLEDDDEGSVGVPVALPNNNMDRVGRSTAATTTHNEVTDTDDNNIAATWRIYQNDTVPRVCCYVIVLVFVPLMVLSTANAVYNTFFRSPSSSPTSV